MIPPSAGWAMLLGVGPDLLIERAPAPGAGMAGPPALCSDQDSMDPSTLTAPNAY